jgi:tetratricopeptide (TPR) repeat protein
MEKSSEEKYKEQISSAWKKYEENDSSGAEKLAKQIKSDFPEKIGSYYLLGIIYFDKKEFGDSVLEFKTALKKDLEKKAGGYIHYWLGRNYGEKIYSFEKDNPSYNKELSRISYENALDFEDYPDDVINKLNYIYQNEFKRIQLFKKAVKKFPNDLNFRLSLSFLYEKVGKADEQEKILLEAKDKFESSHILYELGRLYLSKDSFALAISNFQNAEKVNKNTDSEFVFHFMLGNTFRKTKEYEVAKEYYLKAFKKEQNNNNFWFGLFGILLSEIKSGFIDFSNLLSSMEITRQFIIDDWFGDMPIFLDSQRAIGVELPSSEKDLIKALNDYKKTQKENDIFGKIELIKYSLYKNIGDENQQLKSLTDSIKYLNTYHYEFILSELAESYSNQFYSLTEEGKSIDGLAKEIISTLKEEYSFREIFVEKIEPIVEELHKQKKYKEVIDIYELISKSQIDKADIWFEVGYAFNELKKYEKAKFAYKRHIELKGETSAVLNNLANIYKREDKLDEAIDMYQKALILEKDDEIAKNNLNNAIQRKKKFTKEADKKKALDSLFLRAIELLKTENYFILESLNSFILNCKNEEEFENWKLPIQDEMFPVLLHTNARKAYELRDNWISKNYIIKTEESNEFDIPFFQLNPYIESEVTRLRGIATDTNLPKEWLNGLNNISLFQLEEIDYTASIKKIEKINQKFKPLVLRDFNELVFNYLVGNRKTTVILSGSFVELLLTYYCERKKLKTISYTNQHGNTIRKNLYDCVLFDLISFIEEKKFFGNDFFPLSNLSRVYRNFVHPGVELKNILDKTKSDLCFISSLEILRKII